MVLNIQTERQVWANSVDPDQTAPEGAVWSGSTLFAILPASLDAVLYDKTTRFKFKDDKSNFWVSKFYRNIV